MCTGKRQTLFRRRSSKGWAIRAGKTLRDLQGICFRCAILKERVKRTRRDTQTYNATVITLIVLMLPMMTMMTMTTTTTTMMMMMMLILIHRVV